jgi:hypothetical protein
MAIQQETAVVQSTTAPRYLVDLANRCLLKDPKLRTRFVNWATFEAPTNAPPTSPKDEVSRRVALQRATLSGASSNPATVTSAELRRAVIEYLKVAARSIRATGNLPPITATLYPKDGSGLCIAFDPSVAHELSHGMRAYVHVEILDAAAKAIVLFGCACLHDDKPDKSAVSHMIFEGIYDLPTMYQFFEDFIYAAFLWAQRTPEARVKSVFWPIATEAT